MAERQEEEKEELSQEELEAQEVNELPDREAMSIIQTFPSIQPVPVPADADGIPTVWRQ